MIIEDANRFKNIEKREWILTYYLVNYVGITPREYVIGYFERMIELYKANNGDKEKITDFQNYLDEFKDTAKYLERIETDYESLCVRFRGDKECIGIMHDNLISACKELGDREKVAYYETRKRMLLDSLSEVKKQED